MTSAVLGVDACQTGWAGIMLRLEGGLAAGVYATSLAALLRQGRALGDVRVVAIDMPIGIPDIGTRRADQLVRAFVGARRNSVFTTPVRAALEEATHAAASARNRELTGQGISQQAFGLRTKLREVDSWVTAAGCPVIEVHPEASFTELAGRPSEYPKKTWTGAAQRRALLSGAGITLPDDLGMVGERAAVDDVLDATVAAWTARRYATGTARCLPDPPERFSDGHSCAIWV
jgi:predicted RNase H-like nuclease